MTNSERTLTVLAVIACVAISYLIFFTGQGHSQAWAEQRAKSSCLYGTPGYGCSCGFHGVGR